MSYQQLRYLKPPFSPNACDLQPQCLNKNSGTRLAMDCCAYSSSVYSFSKLFYGIISGSSTAASASTARKIAVFYFRFKYRMRHKSVNTPVRHKSVNPFIPRTACRTHLARSI